MAAVLLLGWLATDARAQEFAMPETPRSANAASGILERPASLVVRGASLASALTALAEQSGAAIAFSPSLINQSQRRVTCDCERATVAQVLDQLLLGTPFRYLEMRGQVLVYLAEQELRPPANVEAPVTLAIAARGMMAPVYDLTQPLPQVGSIRGQVVERRGRAPLAAARVFLADLDMGVLTDSNGRFLLLNVPAGTQRLSVAHLGYRPVSRDVEVRDNETTTVNFELEEEALALDRIVVTGTAGEIRRREMGNTVAQIDPGQLDEPVANVDALIQGRAAGVTVLETSGQVGSGAAIRLRGNVSASLSNQPLIYIDGIRVRGEGLPKNAAATGSQFFGPSVSYSPLNDIDPADIERIEIVRGAAATTLYGTEAAAGVIHIITKRGRTGAAQWSAQIDQGFSSLQRFGPTEGHKGEPLQIPEGEPDPGYMYMEPFLRDRAWRQHYRLSVSGGLDNARYYLSGSWRTQEGVLPKDEESAFGIRGNFDFVPFSKLQLAWNTSYLSSEISQTEAGPSAPSIFLNATRRDQNFLATDDPEEMAKLLDREDTQDINHFTTSLTAKLTLLPWLSQQFVAGYDLIQQDSRSVKPFGFVLSPQGVVHENRWRSQTITLEYLGTVDRRFSDQLRSVFSFGGQAVTTDRSALMAYGERLPGPGGTPTISSTATNQAFADRERVTNAGFFLQNLIDWKSRYFLTLGARVDGSSTFGRDLGLEAYPKASVSYLISDEPFWKESWGELKLRFAWGQSGRAPGAFDAQRNWLPVGWGDAPAVVPNNQGNPVLGPERTTETELGFDASLLEGRVVIEGTWYRQKTTDALFPVAQPGSGGFLNAQLENVGSLENRGVEFTTRLGVIDALDWGLEVGATVYTNRSKVLDLGEATEFGLIGNAMIREGQPVPVIVGACVANPDEKADPIIEEDCIYGPNLPTFTLSPTASLRLPGGVRLTARGEYQSGAWAHSYGEANSFPRGIRWPSCLNAEQLIQAGRSDELTALERARCIANNARPDFGIFPLDFFKLREVTVAAPVPVQLPGVTDARLTLSARNVFRWRKADNSTMDPESTGTFANRQVGMLSPVHTVGGGIPAAAVYTLSLRVNF